MSKHQHATKTNPTGAAAVESAASRSISEHQQIALQAYFYWQARGCPLGSPDEDWFAAEAALRKPAAAAAAAGSR